MPRPPETPQPFRFPLVASLAPLGVAVVLWGVTRSPFALLFAALGPVTAAASYVDSRLGGRRHSRREAVRFAGDLAVVREEIRRRHGEERASRDEAVPSATMIVSRSGPDPYRWAGAHDSAVLVTVGRGDTVSDLELDRSMRGTAADGAIDALERDAALLDDAPVVVDARLGIGVCGPPAIAHALARALAVQLAWNLSPATTWLVMSEPEFDALPHERPRAARAGFVLEAGESGSTEPFVVVAVAETPAALPGSCRVVLAVSAGSAQIVQHPVRGMRLKFSPAMLSREQSSNWAIHAQRDALRDGLARSSHALPDAVELGPVLRDGLSDRFSLECEFAVGQNGPVTLDLVTAGPHAIVGGTTGSGKSELLVSWVLAMAAAHPPDDVTFLLVDFKGGSAFAPLAALPHTVGIVTDLDEEQAARALASLRAELHHRERSLAAAQARSIEDTTEPRLVIVIDEFAAMMSDHPDLHALFADVASRGRSLGVHLVLCTQRPSGVVRDAILANADLRISLRVNNRADSTAVVGTDAAATIPARCRGRGILAPTDGPPQTVQFAMALPADVERIAARWTGSPRRPWCDPLPLIVEPNDAVGGFGVLDMPEEQRRAVATWDPVTHGHVLVLGGPRSGKTTALAALGAPALSSAVASAWDSVCELAIARNRIVGIDDLDSLLARFPAEHRDAVIERLGAILRDGPARGIHVAITAQRITAEVQQLAGLLPERLMLRHASRHEFVLAGGDGAHYRARLPPGGGVWHGHRVQIALAPTAPESALAPRLGESSGRPLAIVTTRSAMLEPRLRAAGLSVTSLAEGAEGAVILGEVEEWQSRWGALASLRPVTEILFDACTVSDYRALTRSRELPPPLTDLTDVTWRWEHDGSASRVVLPV